MLSSIYFGLWLYINLLSNNFVKFSHFYFRNQRELLYTIQEKYNFGFQDYIKGNKIFERALAVNRLEELLDKREKFDWTGVPEL